MECADRAEHRGLPELADSVPLRAESCPRDVEWPAVYAYMYADMYTHIDIYVCNMYIICVYMGMCFFDVAVPGGWHKGYESQVWFGVWLGGMIRGMARAPLNSCFVALDTAKLPCAGNWIAVRIWTA